MAGLIAWKGFGHTACFARSAVFFTSVRNRVTGNPGYPISRSARAAIRAEKIARRALREKPEVPLGSLRKCADDQPVVDVTSPYEQEKVKCILCKYQIHLDYKNARLLSQFISSFSGRLYEKHVTGLCQYQQSLLHEVVAQSRRAGYMPVFHKDPLYLKDPKLFDPMNPQRPNPF